MRLMRELRKNKKKKGMLALEAAMALLMVVMASYGVAATSAMEFSQMAASRTAKQAEQYAELEADYLRMVGFYHFDDGSTVYDEPHARQSMTKIIGDDYGSQWESKVTHVNDITVDKFTSVKVARIDVYKAGDGDVPRFTLEVPLTSSSGDVPIGGIITWPSDTLPDWFNEDQYLECNGQSFDTSEYPHLAELYPDGKVPNYSGLFLRGSGSQSYSQVNGAYFDSNNDTIFTGGRKTSTLYTSGAVGEIQGDARRPSKSVFPNMFSAVSGTEFWDSGVTDGRATWYGIKYAGYYPSSAYCDYLGSLFSPSRYFFATRPKHYRYRLVSSGSGENASYSLEEYTSEAESDEGVYRYADFYDIVANRSTDQPTANEFRPVNMAVRYFIRAR